MAYIGFDKLTDKLKAKGVKNPNALAASIGRKKYGKKGMSDRSKKGRLKAKAQADALEA